MSQKWSSKKYARDAAFVSALGADVVALLNPQPGEQILDLGCGDGTLAKKLAASGCDVTGVDASEDMVRAAQKAGVQAHCISGEALDYQHQFDAVFSNAALHWMLDYHAVLTGVFNALKPGGRFVAECGGKGNIQAISNAIQAVYAENPGWGEYLSPWFFPSDTEYEQLLKEHGFVVQSIALLERPTPLDSGITEWLRIFAHHATNHLDQADTEHFIARVAKQLAPVLYNESSGWHADYVRLRFSATKPVLD